MSHPTSPTQDSRLPELLLRRSDAARARGDRRLADALADMADHAARVLFRATGPAPTADDVERLLAAIAAGQDAAAALRADAGLVREETLDLLDELGADALDAGAAGRAALLSDVRRHVDEALKKVPLIVSGRGAVEAMVLQTILNSDPALPVIAALQDRMDAGFVRLVSEYRDAVEEDEVGELADALLLLERFAAARARPPGR